jgi:cation diffusion facilitator family transporter
VIAFNQAIFVAVVGLVVNGVSALILNIKHDGHNEQEEDAHRHHKHHHDHNLRSAYLHVLADALTSVLAIFALLTAKYFGLIWMDPLMGIAGAILISYWSLGLLRVTSRILLDEDGPENIKEKIKMNIESDGDSKVTDLHLWSVGPKIYSVIISVVAHNPLEPEQYKSLVSSGLGLVHITVEVCKCKETES